MIGTRSMRGGSVDLKKVFCDNGSDLGKFKKFVKLMDGQDPNVIKCKNFKTRPQGAADDDVHPEITQFIIALGYAVREINKAGSLADPALEDLYVNCLTANEENSKFFSQFFQLNDSQGSVPLLESARGKDLKDYKLSPIKIYSEYQMLSSNDNDFDETKPLLATSNSSTNNPFDQVGGTFSGFIALIPNVTGNIWLDGQTKFVSNNTNDLITIFVTVVNADNSSVPIFGVTVDLVAIFSKAVTITAFSFDWTGYYNELVSKPIDGASIVLPSWLSREEQFRNVITHHLAKGWTREGDDYIHRGTDGKPIEKVPIDDCAFITTDATECMSFLENCVYNGENVLSEVCQEGILRFNINIPMTQIAELVQKINPKTAFAILNKFGFGTYTESDPMAIPRGLRRTKVQSVGSWLKDLDSIAEQQFGPSGKATAEKVKKMNPLLNYLELLVQWVNVNPQLLNPEETNGSNPDMFGSFPKINEAYNTYRHVNPYKAATLRLSSISCGLDRLRASVENQLSGFNAPAVISNIASVPLGIQMPLNRNMFTTGMIPAMVMTGGDSGMNSVEEQFSRITDTMDWSYFKGIYDDLINTMQTNGDEYRLKLSNDSKNALEQKFKSFKEAEIALRTSLRNQIIRRRLAEASYGAIDANGFNGPELAKILEKHSNLLNLASAYNRKAVNIINLLQTIAEACISKIAKKEETSSQYNRPMRMRPY